MIYGASDGNRTEALTEPSIPEMLMQRVRIGILRLDLAYSLGCYPGPRHHSVV